MGAIFEAKEKVLAELKPETIYIVWSLYCSLGKNSSSFSWANDTQEPQDCAEYRQTNLGVFAFNESISTCEPLLAIPSAMLSRR